jgi:site-specific recombinase XerD
MDLPVGLIRRGGTYYVKYKRLGKWVRKAVGDDLGIAIAEHHRLRGSSNEQPKLKAATIDDCAPLWLAHQQLRNKPRTVKAAQVHVRRLLEQLGGRRLDSLRSTDIDALIAARRKTGVKDLSINNDLRVLKAMLRWAHAEGLVAQLPTRIRMLRCVSRRTIDVFTPSEVERVLAVAQERVRMLLIVAASTALRLDELVHLQWRNVDFRELRIDVTAKQYRSRRRDGSEVETYWSPKSHAERSIFVTSEIADELRRFRMSQRRSADADWMFQGRRPGDRWVSPLKAIRDAFEAAGIYEKGKLTHVIRHSVATRMLQQGVDLETVRDVLGHADVTTTARYLHVVDERKRAAAQAVGLVGRRK